MRKDFRNLSGILLLDKQKGISSNKALQRVKYLFEAKKAGHTGTLDPFATGLLPICFGEANKFSRWLLGADKTYEFTIKLGAQTDTADSEGEIIKTSDVLEISDKDIQFIYDNFIGEINQIPPNFSALRVNGKRAYALARSGTDFVLPSRKVFIYSLYLQKICNDEIYGRAKVSKGTYIRTLAEDIAKSLGMLGYCSKLRRLLVAGIDEDNKQYSYEDIQGMCVKELDELLLPIDTLCKHFIRYDLDDNTWDAISNGKKVDCSMGKIYLLEVITKISL